MRHFADRFLSSPSRRTPDRGGDRPLTGRMVFSMLIGCFAVVFAVNGVMIYAALSTMSGVDTDSAYQAGRMYEQDVAMAKAQQARHWRVDAKMTPAADGAERLDIDAHDAAGMPLRGLVASAVFERPTDRRLDRAVDVAEDGPGRFHGSAALAAGQWDLVIELSRQGDRLFRSRNRVILK